MGLRRTTPTWSADEQWRPVLGFGDYEVSDLGNVRSWRPLPPPAKTRGPGRSSKEARYVA
jgi:hypothetical protein